MSTTVSPGEQRVVLRDVDWETYLSLAEKTDRPGKLITYDCGVLEIMSPSRNHEIFKSMIGRMVERYAEIRSIDATSTASTTFKSPASRRAFEADESFYIEHESVVRGRSEIDLQIDPPPDLVIEIEQTRSAINKLALFAEFGIAEVWRFDGTNLWIGCLANGQYITSLSSTVLPSFPVEHAVEILRAIGTQSETKLIRRFADDIG